MERVNTKFNSYQFLIIAISASFLVSCNGSLNHKKTYREVITRDTLSYYNRAIEELHDEGKVQNFHYLTQNEIDINRPFLKEQKAVCYSVSINYWPLPITTNTIEIKYADDDFESSFNAWSSLSIPLIWYENNVYDIRLFLKEEKGREIITRDVWMTIKHLHENNIYAFSILDEIVT